MPQKPANNCVAIRVNLIAMLKSLSVALMEKQPETGRSWLNSTTTVVIQAIGVTEETNPAPMRVKSRVTTLLAPTVSAAVDKVDLFFIVIDHTGNCYT